MSLYDPDYIFSKTVNITPDFLKNLGIKNVLLDVDNTLATHGNPTPAPGIPRWVEEMKKAGINLAIVSNNYSSRVKPFAEKLGLPFASFSLKPLPRGFVKAMKLFGATRSDTAVIGDQIFTDVMGAHLMGLKGIMVIAILEEGNLGFKIKRKFEKKYIDRYKARNGGLL